jgi:hypothetical protein
VRRPADVPAGPADLAALGVWLIFRQENVPDPFWATKRDRHRLLAQTEPVPAAAAADMLAWENSGFSVTALAIGNIGKRGHAATGGHASDDRATTGCCDPHEKPRSHDTSRIAWAKLMARVGEEFPLECPNCGGDIRLIACITEPGPISCKSTTIATSFKDG